MVSVEIPYLLVLLALLLNLVSDMQVMVENARYPIRPCMRASHEEIVRCRMCYGASSVDSRGGSSRKTSK